jgi:hypothetical protein
MNKRAKYIICFLFSCIILLYFYTLLHEGGHALVAIMCGAKVDKFVLGQNAHVQTSDATFTIFSEALMYSMGALLPVIFLIIALVVYNPKIKYTSYHIFYGFISLSITGSLLAWVMVPFISLFTLPPAGDDVTKFLNITSLHPLIVMITALLIIIALVFLIYKRGLIGKIKEINCELLQANRCKDRKVLLIRWFIGISLGVLISVVGFSVLVPKPVFETSLSMEVKSATENVKLPFKIEKSKFYSMNLELEAKDILTDIQIYTDNGTLIYQNICEWLTLGTSLKLEKGNYVFVLTFLKDLTGMQEHFKSKGYTFKADVLERLKAIYNKNNSVDNYPVSFSVTIK